MKPVEVFIYMMFISTVLCIGISDAFWSRFLKTRLILFYIFNAFACIGMLGTLYYVIGGK
jgi:hypothetical protein